MRPIDADKLLQIYRSEQSRMEERQCERINKANSKSGMLLELECRELEKLSTWISFCEDIIIDINNAPTIEYGTWIPCSERLPECEWGSETGALMFQLKDSGYIEVGFFGTGSMWRDKYFRTYNNLHGYDASSVIAWMPLPEPYREEKKDE